MVEVTREHQILYTSIALLANPNKNAAAMNNVKKIMLEMKKFPIDTQFETSRGATTLHIVCQYGTADMVNLVAQAGASMDVTDDLGYTPIHYACRAGNLSTFNALAELGGEDFDVTDIPDHVVNNLTGLIFLNKYSLGDLKKGDLSGFFGDLVFPPIPPLEAGIREVSGIQEERKRGDPEFGDDLLKTMPIMGRILYDWVMGGKEKAAADREKEIMAQYD